MPRHIFKNRIIAAAGPLPGQLTVDNLKRWTQIRKGQFTDDFDEDVTHLLCTRDQFNKRVPRVKDALKRGKHFHIVHYDWFEFSTVQEKREPEREYSMRNILAKQNASKREQARIEKGKKDGEKFVNTNFFHIYTDRDFFSYQINLTRDDETAGEFGQKYTLCLWESDAKPHLYWFTAKFLKKRGNSQPSYHRPSPCSGKWRVEMDLFMEFFRIKTGVDWEDRVIKTKTMPNSLFQYAPPTGGKPVGRRLRFHYDYCREVNAELRGLPWPPPGETAPVDKGILNAGPLTPNVDAEKALPHDEKMQDCEQSSDGNDKSRAGSPIPDEDSGPMFQATSATNSENSPTNTSPSIISQVFSPNESTCTSPGRAGCAVGSQCDDRVILGMKDCGHSVSSTMQLQMEESLYNPEFTGVVNVMD
ncbi:hypothetical protein G7Z17_g12641 [Cylindrodendrum hubeiense]|uniref:BRCT domain-containing protein n=1 Tax=Cylindrodendrum hubeiense TaxID=595255 RepID=A0A9P5L2X3_9HYPO|nr:hypothetical protein G7Z17_g12641 [Cylindrodendrum hubeiense]